MPEHRLPSDDLPTGDHRVPPRLAEALRELEAPMPDAGSLDRRLRSRAADLAQPQSVPLGRLPWRQLAGVGGAIAAMLALGVVLWPQLSASRGSSATSQAPTGLAIGPGDIDRDGRVTILDAYVIARGLRTGEAPIEWDADADGVVTLADADAIARAAVTLVQAGRSAGGAG